MSKIVKFSFIDDICAENLVINLTSKKLSERIGAWSGLLSRLSGENWDDVCLRVADLLKDVFSVLTSNEQSKVWLFITNEVEQPDNRIVRHKGFKSSLGLEKILSGDLSYTSVVIESGYGIRFAALVEVEMSKMIDLLRLVRDKVAFFFISEGRPSPDMLRELFLTCLGRKAPYSSFIDWQFFLETFEFKENLICRITGDFDDLELGIDIFGDLNELNPLRCYAPSKPK